MKKSMAALPAFVEFTIYGQPFSKANSRKSVLIPVSKGSSEKRVAFVKSPEALQFEEDALAQIPWKARVMYEGEVTAHLWVWYASERSDLDESIVLDVMQAQYEGRKPNRVLVRRGIYNNDRQVRERHVYHAIDAKNPRVHVRVEPRAGANLGLFAPDPDVGLFEDVQGQLKRIGDELATERDSPLPPEIHFSPDGWLSFRRGMSPLWKSELLLRKSFMGFRVVVRPKQAEPFLIHHLEK